MKKAHEIRGLAEPQLRQGIVNQVLKGKRNIEQVEKRSREDKGRLPVTLTLMKLIKETIRAAAWKNEKKLLVWAVCALAFHGSFRIHEILCRKESSYDPDFTLLGQDVKLLDHTWGDGQNSKVLQVTLKCPKESKTGQAALVDVYETGGPTCPIRAYCKWIDCSPKENDKILFKDTAGTPLTGRGFNAILRQLLEDHIDYRKGKVTAHSFRSGVPSLLGSLGYEDDDIKRVGRWSSRAFECYTKLPRTSRAAIARRLGKL
jgi:hypothetical protein